MGKSPYKRIEAKKDTDLTKAETRRRKRKKFPNVFFKKEIIKLFGNITDARTMMGSFMAFFCALRISEVAGLKWKNVNLEEGRLKVVDGKNHKDGYVPISPQAIGILKRWRDMNPDEEYFLPTEKYKTGHYQADSLYRSYVQFLKKAGLRIPTEKTAAGVQQHQYKFHTLRHSRCTHLLANGVPVQKVQKFMRHDDLDTTMVYTWILDKEMTEMVKRVDNKHRLPAPVPQLAGTATVAKREEPLVTLKRRLVSGEIGAKEYKKLVKVLGG